MNDGGKGPEFPMVLHGGGLPVGQRRVAHALPCRLEPVTKCRSHISEIGKPCKTAENAVLLAVFTQNLPTNSVEEAKIW